MNGEVRSRHGNHQQANQLGQAQPARKGLTASDGPRQGDQAVPEILPAGMGARDRDRGGYRAGPGTISRFGQSLRAAVCRGRFSRDRPAGGADAGTDRTPADSERAAAKRKPILRAVAAGRGSERQPGR